VTGFRNHNASPADCLQPYAYTMRMARVNVYLPDDLAEQAKDAGLNVSSLTQDAVRSALSASQTEEWLKRVGTLSPTGIRHDAVMSAVSEAKDDLEGIG